MPVFFLISAGICFFVALSLFLFDLLRYCRAVGRVIGNTFDNDEGDAGGYFAPRVRFRTRDGIDREFQSAVYVHRDRLEAGTPIPVRYNPTVAWLNGIDRWYCRWAPVIFVACCGGVFATAYWLI
jgi:hypothetical protein